jgi:hypothetical protein
VAEVEGFVGIGGRIFYHYSSIVLGLFTEVGIIKMVLQKVDPETIFHTHIQKPTNYLKASEQRRFFYEVSA